MAVSKRQDEYFDALETMSPAERERFQSQRLVEVIDHAYRHAPAARELLDAAGVSPASITMLKDMEKLPITRKTDLIELQKADLPYGGFLAIPPEDVERVFLSPGPVYEPIQHSGVKWFAKAFWAAGFRKGDIVVNTFTYHMSPAGILFHEALRDCGATAIPMGTGNTEIQLQTMYDLKVTGFVGTPTFLITIIKRAEEMGYDFRQDFALRRAWFTGEMLPPSLRNTFETDYHIATAQAYAVTEPGGAIAYECHQKSGMHFMDEYAIEIVDPETGKQLCPGRVGEIVVTPLHNQTWGLLRFGTGDMSTFITELCPCGRTSHRLTGIVGRTSDAIKVRGMFVVTRQAEAAIMSLPAVSAFQLVVGRRENRDDLTLKVELRDDDVAQDRLTGELEKRFQEACRLKLDRIDYVPKGTFPSGQPKVVDERKWE